MVVLERIGLPTHQICLIVALIAAVRTALDFSLDKDFYWGPVDKQA
jgi:hypothetical protein